MRSDTITHAAAQMCEDQRRRLSSRYNHAPGRRAECGPGHVELRVERLPRLVLASTSPRRQALIGLLGLQWRVLPVEIAEDAHLLADPLPSALNVALAKARAAVIALDELVLAADTLVVDRDHVLGKPSDAAAAEAMLRGLRNRGHAVLTGVALRAADGQEWGAVVSSRVRMRAYLDDEIRAYVARGEPFDKAGGYAVQDTHFRPVAGLEGCYLNVVGLPLCAVAAGLEALGVPHAAIETRVAPCSLCRAGSALVQIGA